MNKSKIVLFVLTVIKHAQAQKAPTNYVNPLLGTASLWNRADIGYKPTQDLGAEVFPGSSVPNAIFLYNQ